MTLRTQRNLQALLFVGLGLYFLNLFWSGRVFWYINQRFALLTLFAALGFLALASTVVLRSRPAGPVQVKRKSDPATSPDAAASREDHEHNHGHEHDQASLSRWAIAVVAVPLLLGLLVPAKPLGSTALANKGVNAAAPGAAGGSASPLRLELDPAERTILDWVRAFNFEADPAVYEGQPADVIGFVYHDARLPADQFLAARFAVSCCVADATGIGMVVQWPEAAGLADNTWVRVRGPVGVAALDGRALPLITAETVEPVAEPDPPYLYP